MSARSRVDTFALIAPVFAPLTVGGLGYAAYKIHWARAVKNFLTGPGRTSRITLLIFVIFNWKNVPFAWTFRLFYGILYHYWVRTPPRLGPRSLFKPIVTTTRAPLMEIDYNLHKSNSTFFTDLDMSRSHLASYLLNPALAHLTYNTRSRLVIDPKTGEPFGGALAILLGAVQCSFRREVPPYKPYELWSSVLCWDRKWLYIVTHFVPRGAAKPTRWLDAGFSGSKGVRGPADRADGWESKIIASAVSKYVFKVGRFTVHPAIMLGDSGLLPDRPGGWVGGGENQVGDESVDLADVDLSTTDDDAVEWDWRRVEAQRRRGMELAQGLDHLEGVHGLFDGGSGGALARAWPN